MAHRSFYHSGNDLRGDCRDDRVFLFNLERDMSVLIAGLAFYLFPTLVAMARGLPNKGQIFVLNLFLGWTFFCWVLALVWAVGPRHERGLRGD